MNGSLLFLLVNVVIVAITTSAPVANEDSLAPAVSSASNAEDMITVGKRAKEMMYFGNQQNAPRVPMKKSSEPALPSIPKSSAPLGEEDQGATMVVHEEVPVEEDLNDRAEAVRGESDLDRLAEGMKVAEEQMESSEEEPVVKDKKEGDGVVGDDQQESAADDSMVVHLPESGENSDEHLEEEPSSPVINTEQNNDEANDEEEDEADEELASLSNDANSSSDEEENEDKSESSDDEDVEEFLNELRKESEDSDRNEVEGEETDTGLKGYKEDPENSVVDPNYYQTLYHILANTYRGADDYYNYNNMVVPSYYLRRRRRSSLRRRDLASIRSRRNGQIRRIKRDLPSDWLAAYRGVDIPYSNEIQDSLLSEPEESYEDDEPMNEQLSRYIYANLLNKVYGDSLQADVEEEVPYEEILPYALVPEIPEPLEEEYEPEEIVYDPEDSKVYREDPYEDYAPNYESYSKRSGAGYYPDSRRKRYFYPFYDEPETHWGAFVPEKRSGYDDALQRLQRLAFALSDNPRPYYENLLREYKKK